MKKSRVFALGLACFLSATAAFGALAATTGGGRFLSNLGDNSSINTDNLMTYKSGLDPENDPVVYTTDYGLEIRYANALTNSNLSGYTYFTMGEYSSKSLNWVIIGYDPSMYEYVQEVSGEAFRNNPIEGGDWSTQFETLDSSAAGSAILRDNFVISKLAGTNFEIGEGRVLCLSENVIESSKWASTNSSNVMYLDNASNYIRTKCAGYYSNDTFKFGEFLSKVKVQTLTQTNRYRKDSYSSVPAITNVDLHFFPLGTGYDNEEKVEFQQYHAATLENFKYHTYLSNAAYTCGYDVWGRSGVQADGATYFSSSGVSSYYKTYSSSAYIRPAFVLEL